MKYKLPPENLTIFLKKEFEFIKDDVQGILLYGSHARQDADERSDIDICLIKPGNNGILRRIFQKVGSKYDIKIFEDLPLYIKMEIIENYRIIYGDEPSISYYFYHFRKNWEDMRYRVNSNRFKTVNDMIITRRKWLEARGQIPFKD
ncbi:MAG: nucleotidyltransferase domain-containing protein [Candidatus Methanoperedens sp.]|nr:nucleotidyltransferase domain-containing protein [Candidatus Methanoperedens sp.]